MVVLERLGHLTVHRFIDRRLICIAIGVVAVSRLQAAAPAPWVGPHPSLFASRCTNQPTQPMAVLGITSDSSSLEANMLTASTASLVPVRICSITNPA